MKKKYLNLPETKFRINIGYKIKFKYYIKSRYTKKVNFDKYLIKLPVYRIDLLSSTVGVEIGLVHGFFLSGPFAKLGPLRCYFFIKLYY